MSRYIDADALKASYVVTSTTTNSLCHLYVSIEDINDAPSIDIVRCHECEHGTWHEQTEMYICSANDQDLYEAGHFCSYGERREP